MDGGAEVRCPTCKHPKTRVLYNRYSVQGEYRRRRVCPACNVRFPTVERVLESSLEVEPNGT